MERAAGLQQSPTQKIHKKRDRRLQSPTIPDLLVRAPCFGSSPMDGTHTVNSAQAPSRHMKGSA